MRNKFYWGVTTLILLTVSVCVVLHQINAQTTVDAHIAVAEKLITDGHYYKAILALEPLLMGEKKSETQEQALWLAHQLAKKCVPVMQKEYGYSETLFEVKTSEKTRRLDQMVGGDFWDFAIYHYDYGYGFLQRLIDEYPNTPKRPIAEYYLIRKGAAVLGCDAETIQAYHAYIEKYEKTGRTEVYMVYRDLAHIHHGLWAAITFPDHPYVAMFGLFGSGDSEKDKKLADSYREIALKYYTKFHINPYGLTDNFDNENFDFDDENNYQLLKRKAEYGWNFILYGC